MEARISVFHRYWSPPPTHTHTPVPLPAVAGRFHLHPITMALPSPARPSPGGTAVLPTQAGACWDTPALRVEQGREVTLCGFGNFAKDIEEKETR